VQGTVFVRQQPKYTRRAEQHLTAVLHHLWIEVIGGSETSSRSDGITGGRRDLWFHQVWV